ncbi:cell division protein ZapE [Rarobacter faecitabidus]|uniref:Cell division protein ZapE n=1 Tax=Rarobacter faecitabidus TaxID=13243 RepID=A0A542ZW61_RARFA|nr:cell division protein ZapE [Rarobacter faecitabidus]TQL64552.1 cell division protein ZapE [Rarobacter faecitabidus]
MTKVLSTSLVGIRPQVSPQRLLDEFVPPKHFENASFATYVPDSRHPSQAATRDRMAAVGRELSQSPKKSLAGIFRGRAKPAALYLDGGFGVGKTHLLASLAHAVGPAACAFGTFVEYTNLVGALGFRQTVEALSQYRLVCIDEFELDDPGDTVLMSRLLRELADAGVSLVATSNTLPEALGEGRFAAEDFLREIQALAARFEVHRIDGEDYRHREAVTDGLIVAPDEAARLARRLSPASGTVTSDEFPDVLAHLAQVHPSQYGAMLDGIGAVVISGVTTIEHQHDALRFVVLVDRLYDRDIPVVLGGDESAGIFTPTMLAGGYRKKYFRTLSRLGALTRMAADD